MEVDRASAMKNQTGIRQIIRQEHAEQPPKKPKTRGLGKTVGVTLKLPPPIWRALHEEAMNEGTNITQLVLRWLAESRERKGLPPIT